MSCDPGLPHWECTNCDEHFDNPSMIDCSLTTEGYLNDGVEVCPNCESEEIRFMDEDDIEERAAEKIADRQLEIERQEF